MGRRGPPKKPTELKLLQGAPGGKHKLNLAEPRPPKVKSPRASFKLGPVGRRAFRDYSAKLEAMGVLTEVDIHALTRLCDHIEEWEKLRDFVLQNGYVYAIYHEQSPEEIAAKRKKRLKYMAQFPQANLMLQLGKEINRLEQQFGLSPSSRTGLNVRLPASGKKDETKNKLYG